jgi:hypothetical protein
MCEGLQLGVGVVGCVVVEPDGSAEAAVWLIRWTPGAMHPASSSSAVALARWAFAGAALACGDGGAHDEGVGGHELQTLEGW